MYAESDQDGWKRSVIILVSTLPKTSVVLCNVSPAKINKEESSALDIKNTSIFLPFPLISIFSILIMPGFSNGQQYTPIQVHSFTYIWLNDALISAEKLQTQIYLPDIHMQTWIRYMYTKVCKFIHPSIHSLTHAQAGCQAFRRWRLEWVQRVSSAIISYTVLPHQAVCVSVYSDSIWVCVPYQTCFNRLYVIICLSPEFSLAGINVLFYCIFSFCYQFSMCLTYLCEIVSAESSTSKIVIIASSFYISVYNLNPNLSDLILTACVCGQ